MKRKVLLSSLAIVLAICLATSSLVMALDDHLIADTIIGSKEEKIYSTATLEDDFADDKVLVVLTNKASLSSKNYSVNDFAEVRCTDVRNLTEVSTALAQAKVRGDDTVSLYRLESNLITFSNIHDIDTEKFNRILTVTLENPGKENVLAAIKALEVRQDIRYVGPSYYDQHCATTTNDTYKSLQWAIDKISLPQAWDITDGSLTLCVGVIDSGIDSYHYDLNGVPNTGLSRDFTSGSCATVDEVIDEYGHGSHVAGIIAACTNNKAGISGTAWFADLVSLRVNSNTPLFDRSKAILAIEYATEKGIPILNYSNGGYQYDQAMYEAIENYQGLFICGAGNDNYNIDNTQTACYPASYDLPNIISVGASTSADTRWADSNYGATSVDLFAPGVSILSCYPEDMCENGTHDTIASTHYANGYHYMTGTSMAAPFVTGVAVMILAENPNFSTFQLKNKLLEGVDSVANFSGLCVTGGRLNAFKAVHSHAFSYTSLNATKHTCTCSCGYSRTENHSWTTISTNDASTNATIRTCGKCGYSKPAL